MDALDDFKIQFSGLKPGVHDFEADAGPRFFELMDQTSEYSGEVKVQVTLAKRPHMLELDVRINGWLSQTCDRCAVAYRQPIEGQYKLFVKFGDITEAESTDDDIIVLQPEAYEVDLAQFVYENIVLALPLRRVPCDELGTTELCDTEVLNHIDEHLKQQEKNPIWDALNDLKNKLNN